MLKRFLNKQKAFTLTELLIALTIIGAVSAMAIPNLFEGIHKRTLVTQLKNVYGTVQKVAREQLATRNTKNLLDTDFGDPDKLLTDKNFHITKKCSSAASCYSAQYKTLNKAVTTRVYEDNPKTIVLKNGQILSYKKPKEAYNVDGGKDRVIGVFYVDVNGVDKPNVVGRDVFWFYITQKGKVVDYYIATGDPYNKDKALSKCKSGETITGCISLVMRNGWEMNY